MRFGMRVRAVVRCGGVAGCGSGGCACFGVARCGLALFGVAWCGMVGQLKLLVCVPGALLPGRSGEFVMVGCDVDAWECGRVCCGVMHVVWCV